MSLTNPHQDRTLSHEAGTTSWAPEINDLQTYRDSLRVMAERVSQAEDIWAKSFEPPESPQSPPSTSRHIRKLSKFKRPTPLQKPFLPKRIRTEGGNSSPDPFQLLSPDGGFDEIISPSIESSADISPGLSPVSTSSRQAKRPIDVLDCASNSPDADQLLKKAEDLLYDAQQIVKKALAEIQSTGRSRDQPDVKLAAKSRATSKQVRSCMEQARSLSADARRRSITVPPDSELFKDPLDTDDEDTFSTTSGPPERLSALETRLKAWVRSVVCVRQKLAMRA